LVSVTIDRITKVLLYYCLHVRGPAMQESGTLYTLFDLLKQSIGSADVAGPCVGDDREQQSPFHESVGPSVGDDGQILVLVQG
jgi:hypothetical protein